MADGSFESVTKLDQSIFSNKVCWSLKELLIIIITTVFFRNDKFCPGHAFIGFQNDTPAAVIFQSTNFLRKLREQGEANVTGWEMVQNAGALSGVAPEELVTLQEDSEQWKDAVSSLQSL